MKDEKWLSVRGYEGYYEVSDAGEVRSLDRLVGSHGNSVRRLLRGKTLIQRTTKKNYKQVALHKNGDSKVKSVHRLVLEAFVGPCPKGMQCCHANGVQDDNSIGNLRWDTQQNNNEDKELKCLEETGRRYYLAKLTPEKVGAIRKLYKLTKATMQDLADLFDVSRSTIYNIVRNKSWRHESLI